MKVNAEAVREAVRAVAASFPLSFAYLHGSMIRNAAHQESDIDIAVGLPEDHGEEEILLDLLAALNEKLAVPTEQLDVHDFMSLPLALQFQIVRAGELIYVGDVKAHRRMALRTTSRYHDEKRFMNEATRSFLERAAGRT